MALVTIQRSPSSSSSPSQDDNSEVQDKLDPNRNPKSLSECYFAGKGTAVVLPDADPVSQPEGVENGETTVEDDSQNAPKGGSNAYQNSAPIQRHLQCMFNLLRTEETLKMAVKLESVHPSRTRYLVVASRQGSAGEECCLLGIDCNEQTTVGLVLRILANTSIRLDGDGGFSVSVCERHHIFKPVSVQAMWSSLQTLHKISGKAREGNYFQGGGTHSWVEYYENHVTSDRSCLNEWHAMDCLESRRPPSPDSIRARPTEREETEKVIRATLKEIMMSVDLDEVTSKVIRTRLEEQLDMDLAEYKSFIDQEMLVILGQMDAPTEIFEHVFLGSEWNASNFEELRKNGVGHILNVTREIDNFFPGSFKYCNVRVYDDEKTDLLKHLDDTFKYISKARNEGSKVLVHCKMGISRSATVVIAYAMKAYRWEFSKALQYVKERRNCIKPNTNFLTQLETYQGILDAMKNKEKLQRSKSETNLKSPTNSNKTDKVLSGKESIPITQALSKSYDLQSTLSGQDLRQMGARPKSWSPDNIATKEIRKNIRSSPGSVSLEDLTQARHVLMPCDNGESYSVSPNQIVHLPGRDVSDHSSCSLSDRTVTSETWDPGEVSEEVATASNVSDSTNSEVCDSKLSVVECENIPVWTSSAVVVTQSAVSFSNLSTVPESRSKSGSQSDLFSNQLDRVFDKEEKKQKRRSVIVTDVTPADDGTQIRECPSRQSSWSSYDSAVVMGEKNELSRHSSWGSGDTRNRPSRNSSWGSYDMRPRGSVYYNNEQGVKILHSASDLDHSSSGIFPYTKEDIPWHPGTVRRTKQRIEGGAARQCSVDSVTSSGLSPTNAPSLETLSCNFAEAVNNTIIDRLKTTDKDSSAISSRIDIPIVDTGKTLSTSISRLSVSAPEPSSMELVSQDGSLSRSVSNVSSPSKDSSSVKNYRHILESPNRITKKLDNSIDISNSLGKVQNLKKEFEAKSNIIAVDPLTSCVDPTTEGGLKVAKQKGNSVPSSPVSNHVVKDQTAPNEDLNFESIRSKFESNEEREVKLRQKYNNPKRNGTRYSCFEVTVNKNLRPQLISNLNKQEKNETEYKKPPIVKQLAATVIATATKKKQQYGNSHPLAKINIRPRHNNPVYNTM
ncbi:protein phosphatase Slingshot isoform X2 [Sitophilus oryzae]|uniref:protein-serine/threonine phosphatase n=1 Tax=Sitophilus oryzae TaxID=7048 RepID=A0A6J2X7A9_SITOR|nr:protein phosphatase Slingshot isoform X2 [Sitophilus oryzae]